MHLAPHTPSGVGTSQAPSLSTLTYRSRVVNALSPAELDRLAQAARRRNRAEGVSTLMLFDGVQIFQWLEGPAKALARVWASVQRDPRHASIEVLDRYPTPLRLFGDFDLKFGAHSDPAGSASRSRTSLADELARLSIAVDPEALAARCDLLAGEGCFRAAADAVAFEAAAHRLGDLWQADDCSEFEVALGLGRLQSCVRRAGARTIARTALSGSPRVLVAPMPGESHGLGASLDADAIWRAGWHPQVEFPVDAAALRRLVAGAWFDVLDLSLSAAFRRDHWLPRMTRLIADARSASRNPGLVVVAAGRVFGESPAIATALGADAAVASSSTVEQTIVGALAMCRLHRAKVLH